MPRKPSIEYAEFKAVALALVAEGRTITFQLLREKLGGVSHDVLKRYLEQFQAERGLPNPGMPESVVSGAHAIYAQAREEARAEIRREYEVLTEALESERQQLEADRLVLTSNATHAAGKVEALESQARQLRIERMQLQERAEGLHEALVGLQHRQTTMDLQRQELLQRLDNSDARYQELIDRYEISLRAAHESGREIERRLLQELDVARQSVAKVKADLEGELSDRQRRLDACLQSAAKWEERATSVSKQLEAQAEAAKGFEELRRALAGISELVSTARVLTGQDAEAIQAQIESLRGLVSQMGDSVQAIASNFIEKDTPK